MRVSTQYMRVYERDSVYVDCTDTLYVVERGDTVRITVAVEVRTGAAADSQKPCRRLFFFIAGAATSILIIFAAKLLIWIYTRKT